MEGLGGDGGEGEDKDEGGSGAGDLGTVGARIDAINRLTQAVSAGTATRSGAIAQMVLFFGISKEQAEELLGPAIAPPKKVDE